MRATALALLACTLALGAAAGKSPPNHPASCRRQRCWALRIVYHILARKIVASALLKPYLVSTPIVMQKHATAPVLTRG